MKLKIENFGPIKKGEIDLSKRFYLLVGYNNTGKTYLSKLLFHIFEKKTIDLFVESPFCKEIEDNLDISPDQEVFTITQNLVNIILTKFAFFFKKIIIESFNVENNHFAFEYFSINFEYDWNEVLQSDKHELFFSEDVHNSQYTNNQHLSKIPHTPEINYIIGGVFNGKKFIDKKVVIKHDFISLILSILINNENTPVFLPANRTYILENYEYIFRREKEKREEISRFFSKIGNKAISKEERGELYKLMKNNYTEPVNTLIDEIYKISETKQEKQPFYDNILQKLAIIMGGKIITNKERFNGNDKFYFQVKNKRKQEDLPFYLASSSVNQLSILHLYFEYFVKEKNNFLILDEPEENLHPETQILLMNLLFEFANMNGNKVLMTTHSPLLADVVNNYYYLAYLKQEKIEIPKGIEKYPFDTAIDFLPKDLGVYFFGKGKMQEYVFDKYGASFFDFDKEIRKIKDMGEILTDAIFNHENNTK